MATDRGPGAVRRLSNAFGDAGPPLGRRGLEERTRYGPRRKAGAHRRKGITNTAAVLGTPALPGGGLRSGPRRHGVRHHPVPGQYYQPADPVFEDYSPGRSQTLAETLPEPQNQQANGTGGNGLCEPRRV